MLDLFGTLVAAPTPGERTSAAGRLADVLGCDPAAVERYFGDTWNVRHDGTLSALPDLAAHLTGVVGGEASAAQRVVDELYSLGSARLVPDTSVTSTLKAMRTKGLRVGVLSDASAEIAAAWSTSALAALVDGTVFSCQAGAVKPNPLLYKRIRRELDVLAESIVYVGDGGGDELRGALIFGMAAVGVRRRGLADALAFGDTNWSGPVLDTVEQLPAYLAGLA